MPQNLLRNSFLICERNSLMKQILGNFSQNKKIYKNFLFTFIREFILIEENGLKTRTIFLKQKIFSR